MSGVVFGGSGRFLLRVLSIGFRDDWGERQDLRIVVSVRPGWARNYLTYFSVYSVRCSEHLRAGSDSPGDTSGANAGEESGL